MHDGLAIYCRYCLNAKNKRSFDNLNDEKKQAVYAKREEKKRKKRELDKALYESQRLERLAVAKRKTMARMGTRAIQFDIQREENVRRWQMLVLESNP